MQSRVPSTERKVLESYGCYIVRNVPVGTHALNVPVLAFVRAILSGLYCMYKRVKPNNPTELMRIEWRLLRGVKSRNVPVKSTILYIREVEFGRRL